MQGGQPLCSTCVWAQEHSAFCFLVFLVCGCGLAGTPRHVPLLALGWMECSAVVPCLRRGVHVDALFVECVSPPSVSLGGRLRVHLFTILVPPAVRESHAWWGCGEAWLPALTAGLLYPVKGLPQRGLPSRALVRTDFQPRIIQSGAPGRHLSPDDPVRGTEATAAWSAPDDPVRGVWSYFTG